MALEYAQPEAPASDQPIGQADARLQGKWLLFMRVAWVVVLVVAVGLFTASVPFTFIDAHTICVAADCSHNSYLTPKLARELHQLGFTMDFYADGTTMWSIILECVYVAVGVVTFWRRSDDRMALISSFALITFGAAFRGFNPEAALSPLLYVLSLVMAFFGNCCLGLFFYLFPTGRFAPRWVGLLTLVWIAYWAINNLLLATILTSSGLDFVIFVGLLISVVATQGYRYRRVATPLQRQQTKWVVFGVSLALLGVLTAFTMASTVSLGIIPVLIVGSFLYVFLLLIPLSIGIAILRYRLWDIDIIINRTLVYGGLSACIVGMYVFVVGYLGALFHASGNLLISLIAAGLVAVAFQPLRVLLQRGVNRLVYGLRDEPYVVLARLGQRLQTTLDPDAVLFTIVETVREALKLSYAAIEVQEGATFVLAASAGMPPSKEALRLPLMYQSTPIGMLLIAPRGRDEALTPADLHLVHDLADQIGIAVHTVRLTADLQRMATDVQRSRERLVVAREEERRRLRRDLHDGLGPTLAALALTASNVSDLIPTDPDAAVALANSLQNDIRTTVKDIRRLVYELRPPALDELGLVAAIRERAAQFNSAHPTSDGTRTTERLQVHVETPERLPPLPAAIEVAAYRIVQEALTNVTRHAQARTCTVHLALTDALEVEILDDGTGLPMEHQAGVGLLSMRERAAELSGSCIVEKRAGAGTRVYARLPIAKE
ncbi:MAG: GAF domain-containing sensor histidine kinase [Chloroflexota bacterium]|nr:GAF domain-containing sensor histidine kinase [Chloroflexota bacterium]